MYKNVLYLHGAKECGFSATRIRDTYETRCISVLHEVINTQGRGKARLFDAIKEHHGCMAVNVHGALPVAVGGVSG